MRIHEIMRSPVRTISSAEPVSLAKELFRRYDIHHLIVVDDHRVVGVVADRDLYEVTDSNTQVKAVMRRPAVAIGPDETIRKAAGLLTGQRIGSLPVVEDDKLVGIVTRHDLLVALAKGAAHPAPTGERAALTRRGSKRKPASV